MGSAIHYAVGNTEDIPSVEVLIRKEYDRQGYIEKSNSEQAETPFSPYLRLPTTQTFLGKSDSELIATVSLILDSSTGLPMEAIFQKEIQALRDKGNRLAEVGQLAVDTDALRSVMGIKTAHRLTVLVSLFSLIYHHAKEMNVDYLCIAVHPKHEALYGMLSFTTIAGPVQYKSVNGAMAVAKVLNIQEMEKKKVVNPLMKQIIKHKPQLAAQHTA